MLNIRGALTAMITPFNGGKLDEARLRQQIEAQIAGGIDGNSLVGASVEFYSPTQHRFLMLPEPANSRQAAPIQQ